MIDRNTVARIIETASIVDVVSEFVTLRRAGANYQGLCPFHNERTPSFSVSPARNYCHCFSCGKGGSPVSFLMEHEQMTYPEALRWLAKKYHIEIKEREMSNEERERESERESMFIVNEWASKYYHNILINDVDGRAIGMQYFRQRGFRDDIIEKFQLGFALNNRNAMPTAAINKGYKEKFLLATGLCYKRDNSGELIDRFAGRALFPWIAINGKVVAFGGRKLDRETKGVQQKYVNSPESTIYQKDHQLYGIFQAKKAIQSLDCVYMVEGYTDVISMHQCGIENVVANSGTALSIHQIRLLHRLTDNIVLLYDGDAAGIKAALRGTDMLLEEGMNIKALVLPDGNDPDSFAREHTSDEFREYIKTHQKDIIQFKTELLLHESSDPVQRSNAISSIVQSISLIPNHILRTAYLQDCAMRLRMPEQVLLTQMNQFINERQTTLRRRQESQRAMSQNDTAKTPNSMASTPSTSGMQQTQSPTNVVQTSSTDDMPDEFIPDEAFGIPTSTHQAPAAPAASSTSSSTNANVRQVSNEENQVEMLLLRYIVRHGHETIYNNVETEDGGTTNITVSEYIFSDLQSDRLQFSNPLVTRILNECTEKCREEGFFAPLYFGQHPDLEISRLCSPMIIDRYNLSSTLEIKITPEILQQQVNHLLLDFRLLYVDNQLKEVRQQMSTVTEPSSLREIAEQYKQLQQIRAAISRKLGRNV